uniref:Stabilizer of axonemal microtubules 2 n=1 Tax=Lynx canadensis TaxID=61383 RepID=A0A667H3L4_LYNCA
SGAASMRSWCLCQICTCGFPSKPGCSPIPLQAVPLGDLTDRDGSSLHPETQNWSVGPCVTTSHRL